MPEYTFEVAQYTLIAAEMPEHLRLCRTGRRSFRLALRAIVD